jgi:hypothetical protein
MQRNDEQPVKPAPAQFNPNTKPATWAEKS